MTLTLTPETALPFYRAAWLTRLARPNQLPPEGTWGVWMVMAGRGFGKTRLGAEWLAFEAARRPQTRWAIVAPTYPDARDTCAEGVSGVVGILDRYRRLAMWNRSLGELKLTNGSRIKLFSGDEPERLRGPQFHGAWIDELGSFRYEDAWDQLSFGLRLGDRPRVVVTTTPRPTSLVRRVLKDPNTVVTRGSTFDNAANLSQVALDRLRERYEGTRLGRQELWGELLEDTPGALFTRDILDRDRVRNAPELVRVVVAVDPAVTSHEESDETGICVAGADEHGHLYVLADYSCRATPEGWATRAVRAMNDHGADTIVAEKNQGGETISAVLKQVDKSAPVKLVHASKGKKTRAEPISAMHEQGRIHLVGSFPDLEDQLCTWTPEELKSPDRLDAFVWACTELSNRYAPGPVIRFST